MKKFICLFILAAVGGLSAAPLELSDGKVKLLFADAEGNYAFQSLITARGVRFGFSSADLWKLKMGRKGESSMPEYTSSSPSEKSHRFFTASDGAKGVEFRWENKAGDFVLTAVVTLKNGRSRWHAAVVNKNKQWGIHTLEYPVLGSLIERGKGDVLLPGGYGGGALLKNHSKTRFFRYPGGAIPSAFAAAFRQGDGVYFGAQDPAHAIKYFLITPKQDFLFGQHPDPMCIPGSGMKTAYPVILEPFTGDWYKAADIHREYLLRTGQLRDELRLSRRPILKNFKEAGVTHSGWGSVTATYTRQAGRFFKAPVLNMWAHWNIHRFDRNYPDLFPAWGGFAEQIASHKRGGQVPMPYINGRCTCQESPWFTAPAGIAGRVIDHLGKDTTDFKYKGTNPVKYDNGKDGRAVVMCPGTDFWQKMLTGICGRLVNEYKVPCIYIDQVGAAVGKLCFAEGHRHQQGGANSYVSSYQRIIDSINGAVRGENGERIPLVTEHGGDAWLGMFDGFLYQWWLPYKYAECVPLMPYLYSGYIVAVPGMEHHAIQETDAYAMMQGRFFLWGMLMHVHQREFENDIRPGGDAAKSAACHAYLKQLVQTRQEAKEFMIYGSLIGELKPVLPLPEITANWKLTEKQKTSSVPVTLPAVQATLWRSESGRIGAALVNYSGKSCRFRSEGKYKVDVTLPGRSARFVRL